MAKLFGGNGGKETAAEQMEAQLEQTEKPAKAKKTTWKKVVAVLLAIILFLECAYCIVIFTDLIPPLAKLRSIYIETAMSTMRHQWLAKALIPGDIVQEVIDKVEAGKEAQVGVNSNWDDVQQDEEEMRSPVVGFSKEEAATLLSKLAQQNGLTNETEEFFELFHELDEESVRDYVEKNPDVIANGWANFYVNLAGVDEEGTSMYTTQGDQILAIDAANGLMVIRITGSTYRGVLVIG